MVVDVTFAIDPDLAVVAVQFERAAVMLVGVLFVAKDDWRASTIGLEVEVEELVVGGVDDAENTPVSDAFENLNLGADAIEDQHVNVRNILGLINVGHVSSF